jgi:nitroreductase
MQTSITIRKRCSLKTHLSGKPIEPEKIAHILKAAMLAPSARNNQPWRFIVVQGREAVEDLVDHAFGENNLMARQADVIIVVCARPADDVLVEGKDYYLFDCGLAVENMLLAATDLGLVTHLILRFNEAVVKDILNIPDDVRVVITTPLAYPLEDSYDEAARDRLSQRTRRAFDQVVYYQQWAEPISEKV